MYMYTFKSLYFIGNHPYTGRKKRNRYVKKHLVNNRLCHCLELLCKYIYPIYLHTFYLTATCDCWMGPISAIRCCG